MTSLKGILRILATPFAPGVTMYVMIRSHVKDQLIKDTKTKFEQEKQGKSAEEIMELEKKCNDRVATLESEKQALKNKLQFFNKQT